jgi:alkylation response protein AidB-like acyl-CoA dehydrogenase
MNYFQLSDEQRDIQRAAKEFAEGEFDPDLALELDQSRQFPEFLWKKACQLGFIGINYPEELGGGGLGFLEKVLIMEAFCVVDSGIGSALSVVDIGSEIVLEFGSDEQKKEILRPLARGEKRLSIAFAESDDWRNISATSTVGKKEGKDYLVTGRKRCVLNASLADMFVVLCRESEGELITLIVNKKEGIEVHPVETIGWRMIPFADLSIKEARVPHENRVGSKGDGVLHLEHWCHVMGLRGVAKALGMAQGAFNRALKYSKQREQFGKRLSQFQVIRHKMADMAVGIDVARWLTYRSAAEYDQGRMDLGPLSMAQLEVGRRLNNIVEDALQIFGGYGYVADQSIEHYFRDAKAISVELGTEEEQKDGIAERIFQ